jgi:hypothetical protein
MVEVPGLEPGSTNSDQRVSTCLVYLYLFPKNPVNGVPSGSNPLILLEVKRHYLKRSCIIVVLLVSQDTY